MISIDEIKDVSIQYPGDKTLTARPGATYQEEDDAVAVLQKR